jgi:hypothetical protein
VAPLLRRIYLNSHAGIRGRYWRTAAGWHFSLPACQLLATSKRLESLTGNRLGSHTLAICPAKVEATVIRGSSAITTVTR